MHITIVWICAALAALVCAVMLFSVATFRDSPGGATQRRRSVAVEVLWALVPVAILVGAAAPAVRTVLNAQAESLASLQP